MMEIVNIVKFWLYIDIFENNKFMIKFMSFWRLL